MRVCSLTPSFRRIVIIGHHFVKADWRRLSPTKAVNRKKPGWTKYAEGDGDQDERSRRWRGAIR